jgi:hypothetical protein
LLLNRTGVDGEMGSVLQIVHLKIRLYCVVSVEIRKRYGIEIKMVDIDMDAAYRYIANFLRA